MVRLPKKANKQGKKGSEPPCRLWPCPSSHIVNKNYKQTLECSDILKRHSMVETVTYQGIEAYSTHPLEWILRCGKAAVQLLYICISVTGLANKLQMQP